jgi:hypothetical protein
VPILAVSVQYGVHDYRILLQREEDPIGKPFCKYTPDFMASENDWKCERIFEDADDGLFNFPFAWQRS